MDRQLCTTFYETFLISDIRRQDFTDFLFSLLQIFELMGDNRDSDKEASKNLNSDAESDILKKIDLAFQVVDKATLAGKAVYIIKLDWCR